MTKLFVLPLMVATIASITGGTSAEAKPRMFHGNPGPGGNPGTLHRPRKRCTFKRPCSPMPELNDFDFGRPMPRGGLPHFGTPMPRGGLRR